MLEKAKILDVDQVFVDLEDSVAPALKTDETRAKVVTALTTAEWAARTMVVRVNAVGTPWCVDDVMLVVAGAGDALDCLMLPKVESSADVQFVDRLLEHLETKHRLSKRIALEVQIESPRGLLEIERIAIASPRIESLIFGPGDYAAAAGIPQLTVGAISETYGGDHWHYVLSKIVTVAHAYGLHAIDGPYAAIRDLDGFRTVAARSCALGFDGKWALHPDQIPICNEIYSPSETEFVRAISILEAYAEATTDQGRGAVLYGDEMIDEASAKMARSIAARGLAAGYQA